MKFDGLHAVADYAALYALLRQDSLATVLDDELGDYCVEADADHATMTFSAEGGQSITTAADLIAILDDHAITWGWAHPAGQRDGIASALRKTGSDLGIDELTDPTVSLPVRLSAGEVDQYLDETADIVGSAAVQSTGVSPYYTVRLDDGTRQVYLLTDFSLPEPSFADFATKMPGVMNAIAVNDHRVAVHGMAARLGWHISWRSADDIGRSPTCELTDGTSRAHIDFDRKGRPRGYRCELIAS
ncbi:hypothetical protein QSJ18_08985 [Gordonia sp. ABSL1-1]|uniref:DUF6882 domain-containing protein n=1 Tax=Gordonia sp. ABSL1-1 TaxID=3053923 RepID=UPI0025728F84|nr:DUF6882 domain-containing protein [Gordonia sp. ABSL1-1]MDL9936872.1 hypothetical protein [Gordonia sp. ABSL1-1]